MGDFCADAFFHPCHGVLLVYCLFPRNVLTEKLVPFFPPAPFRADTTHPRYPEFYAVATTCVFGIGLTLAGAGLMQCFHLSPLAFLSRYRKLAGSV